MNHRKYSLFILLLQAILVSSPEAGEVTPTVDFRYEKISYLHNLYDVSLANNNLGWVVGVEGSIFHTPDGGKTWTPQESGTTNELFGVSFVGPQKGWTVGRFGIILGTINGGQSWGILQEEIEGQWSLLDVCFINEKEGWTVGEFGTILHTRDGGKNWESQGLGEDKIYYRVCFSDSQTGWVVGEFGTILHTTDGGGAWKRQTSPRGEASLLGIYCNDKDNAWAVGVDGLIIMTNNGGQNWEELESRTEMSLFDVWIGEQTWWAVGKKGTLLSCDCGSITWRRVRNPLNEINSLNSIVFFNDDHSIIAGDHGTVYMTSTGGNKWVETGYKVNDKK